MKKLSPFFKNLAYFSASFFVLFSCKTSPENLMQSNLNNSKNKDENIHFIVAGHVYGAPNTVNHPFHPPFMKYLANAKADSSIDFTVFTGDIVQESNKQSWDKVDSLLGTLPFKTYFSAGNHDLKNRPLYEERYGDPNFYFSRGSNLFYFVDLLPTYWNLASHISKLKELQKNNNYENIFVFTHHIAWYNEKLTPEIKVNSTYGRDSNQTFYSEVLPVLNNMNSDFYFIGGDVGANPLNSEITLHKSKNVYLICSGMGSYQKDNVLHVKITKEDVSVNVEFLNKESTILADTCYKILNL